MTSKGEVEDVYVISDDSDNDEKESKEGKGRKTTRKISEVEDYVTSSEKRTSQRRKKPRVSSSNIF